MIGRSKKGLKIALLQLSVGFNKAENVGTAISEIHKAKEKGAQLVVLPECFSSPYGTEYFEEYAEEVPSGATCRALARAAAEASVCVVGGTVPERYGNKLYNTCTVWDSRGKLLAMHRQTHLFDGDIQNTQNLNKSDVLSAGDEITTFEYEGTKIGIGICHDLCFPEMAHLMSKQGCSLLVYPGAFSVTLGAEHCSLLARSRASDEQLWVALASLAREGAACSEGVSSMLVDPRAAVVAHLDHNPQTLIADIDFNLVEEVRSYIPIRTQRIDAYNTVHVKSFCTSRASSYVGPIDLEMMTEKFKPLVTSMATLRGSNWVI